MEVNVGDYTIPYLRCENIQRLCNLLRLKSELIVDSL